MCNSSVVHEKNMKQKNKKKRCRCRPPKQHYWDPKPIESVFAGMDALSTMRQCVVGTHPRLAGFNATASHLTHVASSISSSTCFTAQRRRRLGGHAFVTFPAFSNSKDMDLLTIADETLIDLMRADSSVHCTYYIL
jgi:hypothetical protein